MSKSVAPKKSPEPAPAHYAGLVGGIGELLDAARRTSVRTVNAFMTATYWEIGRRIVELRFVDSPQPFARGLCVLPCRSPARRLVHAPTPAPLNHLNQFLVA